MPSRFLSLLPLLVIFCASNMILAVDETIASWAPNRANNFYQTSTKMTAGAEVRVRVVSCPKDRGNGIVLWRTNGDRSTQVKRWDGIDAGQILKWTVDDDSVISISTIPVVFAACKGVDAKDGYHRLTLETGGRVWVLDVKIVNRF